ncbi:MAG TPA: MaoC/PaaZ C-terminal domain-containing protein [Spirochaetota bacterium]|nr:MaoC/PaaZ C-terminal domain-containing protein [Spirochaetota bacterium]HOS33954.1 MaoC/PaaZ C-terminal domain-containing protein [Spirochaetota bacterium]HOS56685.1 MaoC/PaaZ C-terminal domain-containing protein [Spirochaetota bacterium]HPK61979.1 MaoC/PaaZ C-terminal domain-containing protein [Spirochaetota bacterium]HQF79020.1 MaoC/PaaZ C-terminal domain-containing protein [Spirochaetota bacterium]
MKLPKYEDITEGYEIPSLTKEPITQLQLVKYAGASGDFNPIHTIEANAKEAGLDGTIAHGMLVMGMLGQAITNWAGIMSVKSYLATFKSMTKPGDVLTAKGTVRKKYENEDGKFADCKFSIEDQNGEVKVDAKVTVKF